MGIEVEVRNPPRARQKRSLQPRLGARKLRVLLNPELAKAGVRIGRDRFFEVLREHGLLLEPKRANTPRTTQSYHTLPIFTNLIKELEVSRLNQVWVGDLTYLRPISSITTFAQLARSFQPLRTCLRQEICFISNFWSTTLRSRDKIKALEKLKHSYLESSQPAFARVTASASPMILKSMIS